MTEYPDDTEITGDWFCTDCGRGPIVTEVTILGQPYRMWHESHAPSCQGRDDPAAQAEARNAPRKYGRMS